MVIKSESERCLSSKQSTQPQSSARLNRATCTFDGVIKCHPGKDLWCPGISCRDKYLFTPTMSWACRQGRSLGKGKEQILGFQILCLRLAKEAKN